jgi:hypothetical protein
VKVAQQFTAGGVGLGFGDLPSSDLAGMVRFGECRAEILNGCGFRCGNVQQSAERRRHGHAVKNLNFACREVGHVQDQGLGNSCTSAKRAGDRHVNPRRHHIGEFVQRESSLVAVDALRFVLPIARPEPPQHQVRSRREWIQSETEDSTVLSDPVANVHMIFALWRGVAESGSLLGREEPALHSRLADQRTLVIDVGSGLHNSSTLLKDCPSGSLRSQPAQVALSSSPRYGVRLTTGRPTN